MLLVAACLGACQLNHYLVHPRQPPDGTITWSEDIKKDQLLIHVDGARPPGRGPFPTVLVHPEGGKTAAEMNGIIWDLAGRGYVAIATDYKRFIDGEYRRNMFAWRSESDAIAVVDLTKNYPAVDQERIGALGFSQGAVFSLLIAALAPNRIKAVVAYYPVTDFPHWLGAEQPTLLRRWAYDIIRWYFRRESGAESEAQFQDMLRHASPYYLAESIQAPVLLIHGENDTTAPVEESQRMAERLAEEGRDVKLLVVPDAVHVFNFKQPEQAALAWNATLEWFQQYLSGPTTALASCWRSR